MRWVYIKRISILIMNVSFRLKRTQWVKRWLENCIPKINKINKLHPVLSKYSAIKLKIAIYSMEASTVKWIRIIKRLSEMSINLKCYECYVTLHKLLQNDSKLKFTKLYHTHVQASRRFRPRYYKEMKQFTSTINWKRH